MLKIKSGLVEYSPKPNEKTLLLAQVNLTVIRSGGSFGRVRLCLEAVSGTAEVGVDFLPPPVQLLFEARETVKSVHIEILDDSLPEGPEEFSLVMTDVELLGR